MRKPIRSTQLSRRPLLVIDGDSFAHRSYHALPKTILRSGRKPAGAILGFANLLLRLYREEQPRAVLIAWDTLEVPTYRHEKYPAYQSGREFDDALIEQLYVLPEFVAACGFQNAKASGFEADDFLAAAAAAEEKRGGTVLIASGDRDTFQLASDSTTILYPVRGGDMARVDPAGSAPGMTSTQYRFRILSPYVATHPTSSRVLKGSAQLARRRSCSDMAPLKQRSLLVASPHRLKTCGFSGRSPQ